VGFLDFLAARHIAIPNDLDLAGGDSGFCMEPAMHVLGRFTRESLYVFDAIKNRTTESYGMRAECLQ